MPQPFTPVTETKKLARAPNVVRGSGMSGVVTGYASLFGETDLGGDMIVKGAFAETLKKTGAGDRKSTRLNSSHSSPSRMPSSA